METTRNGTLAIYFGFNGIVQAAAHKGDLRIFESAVRDWEFAL